MSSVSSRAVSTLSKVTEGVCPYRVGSMSPPPASQKPVDHVPHGVELGACLS